MTKENKQGKTAKEVAEISARLHTSSSSNSSKKIEEPKGLKLNKKEVDGIVERLFEKNPNEKREEMKEKLYQTEQRERPENFGWQTKSKSEIDELTTRLFIPDYVNKNVNKNLQQLNTSTMPQNEIDEVTARLFISDHTKKKLERNQIFYDQILQKKKGNEKTLSQEELVETTGRLSRMATDPAECNKEMKGKQRYEKLGIYGTFAFCDGR